MKQKAKEFFDTKLRRVGDAQGNTEKRIFIRPDTSENLKSGKTHKVHLIGVCGKAMSSLAGLFAEAGYEVSGSDIGCYPPASDMIHELGIKFYEGFSDENVKGKDLVIIANMFGPDNEEAKYVRENNIPHMSMSEAIAEFFIKNKTSIVITGTHGKTTTTGLCAHVFLSAGRDAGFVVGGVAVPTEEGIKEISYGLGSHGDTKENIKDKKEYFIIEGDEYDTAYFDKSPKFLHYRSNIAVVTSLEFDHADIYADFEEYKKSFIFLAEELYKSGLLVLNGDSLEVRSLKEYTEANVLYYGIGDDNDVVAKDIVVDEKGQSFNLVYKGQNMGRYEICLFGQYNIMNVLSVCAVALHEKLSTEEIQEGLKTFLGMKRRQEIFAKIKGVTFIDDFAHHPTAVAETLSGIRAHFPDRRVIAVFEPRSNTSRKKIFEDDYGKAFIDADALYLSMPALRWNDDASDFIDGNVVIDMAKNMAETAQNKAFEAICVKNGDEVLSLLLPKLRDGDVVVIMSNGSFDGIYKKIVEQFK